jgi:hypothetical protein
MKLTRFISLLLFLAVFSQLVYAESEYTKFLNFVKYYFKIIFLIPA